MSARRLGSLLATWAGPAGQRWRPLVGVADARARARRVLPRVVFDYVDGGADDEWTMAANEAAWRSLTLVPRFGTGITDVDLGTELCGSRLALPILLAPCGLARLLHPDGPAGAARAAAAAGTLAVLSAVAGSPLEEVAARAPGCRQWFQLYAPTRAEAAALVERAGAAGYEALVVTVDTPALGNRERDRRNGVVPPLRLDARQAIALGPQVLARPGWALRMLADGVSLLRSPRPAGPGSGPGRGPLAAASTISRLASPFTWADVAWVRERWQGPLLVKGILTPSDARAALDSGADGLVVSNHGGRQLDGAPATAQVLRSVVAAVGDRAPVLVDGGIRRGSDVVRALALGARAVLIGRPYLWALAAGGQPAVEDLLGVLAAELTRTMVLLGRASLRELGPEVFLEPPT
ncbi:alpha-hydroxy acid oxidase [Aciditerrimonas ferrireducens]|uniref:alpha-hydroxy acid oxidase n=1 Tax=Aciditerrimonas ferrireducens TaxID=667306 RepID=UPI002004B107|nr:alpha-hydroxy acid oxidase [Aciditerrimonas ferrireducens]MCK4176743.1 alpha-hydroxy-acid oxidizing protein [Aciditerrimonas ferrireducens]